MLQMDRRQFLGVASASLNVASGIPAAKRAPTDTEGYRYRIAFGAWINDMRNEGAYLEEYPYAALDDEALDSIIRALDVQAASGYNILDLAGLWVTLSWPLDIEHVADKDRERRVKQILKAAHERRMKVICFPSGVLNRHISYRDIVFV